jgi:hypothetical protein
VSTRGFSIVQRTYECIVVDKMVSAVQAKEVVTGSKEGIPHAEK